MTAKKKSLDEDGTSSSSSSSASAPTKSLSAWETSLQMLKEDGPLAFFQGILPALILVINPTIQYFCFEKLKEALLRRKPKLNDLDFFFLGAVSKLVATGKYMN